MKGRKASVYITYNGKTIKTALDNFQNSFSYTDPDGGDSDSIKINLADPENQWIAAWIPSAGDEIKAEIRTENWNGEGDEGKLDCGVFIIDSMSYSRGSSGSSFSIGAVSSPAGDAFKETERSQTWEKATLKKIAQTIADRYKLKLYFDCEDITIKSKEQSKATDSSFLKNLCDDYGRKLKVYKNQIVIFDREKYKKKEVKITIKKEELNSVRWNSNLVGTYTGGEITYTNGKSGKDIKYKTGTGPRIYKSNEKADSLAEAKLKLENAIAEQNHSAVTLDITVPGRTDITAAMVINVVGIGKASGKYYIDEKTDNVSNSGYTTNLKLSKVSDSDATVLDAIDRLAKLKISVSPEYWIANYKNVKYLDDLLVNMAVRIRINNNSNIYTTADEAIDKLANEGVINTAAYWKANKEALPWLPLLLINAANAF